MSSTFYLKYRPQSIDDLDIEDVRNSLAKIVSKGNIPHAFLFAGPKGTGKTSAARILAKVINCDPPSNKASVNRPCNKCEQCLSIANGNNIDVIEMDAASNRGIDDIRVLRDAVKLTPAKSKAKIYIIDEAHMLTVEASNALLKTLEEPPSHVYFILATTNPEKLIGTIISRTTVINFRKANKQEIKRSLKRIVKAESIKLKDEDLDFIIKSSKGSFRDAVKLLERVAAEGSEFLKKENIGFENLVELIEKKEKNKIFEELKNTEESGLSSVYLIESLLEILRLKLVGETETKLRKGEIIHLIELLIFAIDQIKISPIEQLPLELALYKWFSKIDGPNNLEKNS